MENIRTHRELSLKALIKNIESIIRINNNMGGKNIYGKSCRFQM